MGRGKKGFYAAVKGEGKGDSTTSSGRKRPFISIRKEKKKGEKRLELSSLRMKGSGKETRGVPASGGIPSEMGGKREKKKRSKKKESFTYEGGGGG